MSDWRKVKWGRYVRADGAVVMWDQRSPYPNPVNPKSKLWTAWEPDPSERAISMTNGRLRWPRRWLTAEAAMRAVDKIHPLTDETRIIAALREYFDSKRPGGEYFCVGRILDDDTGLETDKESWTIDGDYPVDEIAAAIRRALSGEE